MRYSNGELRLVATDLRSHALGQQWGHTRSYSNKLNGALELKQNRNGNGWFVQEMPQLVESGTSLGVIGIVQDTLWFDWDATNLVYKPRFFFHAQLFKGTGTYENEDYTLLEPSGRRLSFFAFDEAINSDKRGQFKAMTDPYGHVTTPLYEENRIKSFSQSSSSSSSSTTSTYSYDYYSDGRLQYASHTLDGQNVNRAEYTYHDGSDSKGSVGDLKTVIRHQWNGTDWQPLERSYYRYFKNNDANGFAHALKYVVNPESYHRAVAEDLSPETASDTEIAAYADQAFTYASATREVSSETVKGGAFTTTFDPSLNPDPNYTDGYNRWHRRNIVRLPGHTTSDYRRQIVYTNFAGQVMLKVRQTGAPGSLKEWYEYRRYNNAGAQTLLAKSSAVASYSEADLGLVTLKTASGLSWVYDWYGNVPVPVVGETPGYLKSVSYQTGSASDPTVILQWKYSEHVFGGQNIIYPSKLMQYRSDNVSDFVETTVEYTWLNQFQAQQRTITLPVVPIEENGPSTVAFPVTPTSDVIYDENGLFMWSRDERGVITRYIYEDGTSTLSEQIDDVNSALYGPGVCPWTTVSGFGLNLTSTYQSDYYGRPIAFVGPEHPVDLNGTETTIRRASWTIYQDWLNATWFVQGYQTSATSTVIGPVTIIKKDYQGRVTDVITATVPAEDWPSNPAEYLTSDLPPRSAWKRWSKTSWYWVRDYRRTYFAIPSEEEGIDGLGTEGTHFFQTTYSSGREGGCSRLPPAGTISWLVYDATGLRIANWVGTNATGATSTDPSNGGAGGNNMTKVISYEYDGGADKGDHLVTQTIYHAAGTDPNGSPNADQRINTFSYDFRNRVSSAACRLTSASPITSTVYGYNYDLQNRTTRVTVSHSVSGSTPVLISKREMSYDPLGRVFKAIRYGVNASTGAASSNDAALRDEGWYDAGGQLIKSWAAVGVHLRSSPTMGCGG
ncbi:MAG: hypothetical protein WKF37_02630 [Bryobacteraceae bacterium]